VAITPVYNFIAADAPSIKVRATQLIPGTDNPPVGPIIVSGDEATLVGDWVEMSLRTDLVGRYGGGGYGIVDPPTFTGTALTLSYTAFSYMIDGVIYKTASTLAMTTGAFNFVYGTQAGTIAKATQASTNPAPSIPASTVYMGMFDCTGGALAQTYDASGVPYLRSGNLWRRTDDEEEPTDTPSALLSFFNKTQDGLYFWDGAEYWRLNPLLASLTAQVDTLQAELDDFRRRWRAHLWTDFTQVGIDPPEACIDDLEQASAEQ